MILRPVMQLEIRRESMTYSFIPQRACNQHGSRREKT